MAVKSGRAKQTRRGGMSGARRAARGGPRQRPPAVMDLQRAAGNGVVGALMHDSVQRCAACGGTCGGGPRQRAAASGGSPRERDKLPAQRAAASGAPPERDKLPAQRAAASGAPADRDKLPVQRAATGSAPAAAGPSPAAIGGQPLPSSTRAAMERGFGQDFGGVRVHTDAAAAQQARDLNAIAFTTGPNIYFAPGQFQPGSASGHRLLAHELTHVIQQRAGRAPAAGIDTPGDRYEQEANRVAEQLTRGGTARVASVGSPPAVQRQPAVVLGDLVQLPQPGQPPSDFQLEIPGEKVDSGPDKSSIQNRYRAHAAEGLVRTAHPIHDRGGTDTLWNNWARARGYTGFKEVPGVLGDAKFGGLPKLNYRGVCSPDHVIEAQLGGPDHGANLRLLGRERNVKIGRDLAGNIKDVRKNVKGAPANAVLVFSKELISVGTAGGPDDCLTFDRAVTAASGGAGARQEEAAGDFRVELKLGGRVYAVGVRKSGLVDETSSYAVPGFHLLKLTNAGPPFNAPWIFDAEFSSRARIPFVKAPLPKGFKIEVAANGTPTLKGPASVKQAFPFLSEAELPASIDPGGLRASGVLRPTLPLLRAVEVPLEYKDEQFSGAIQVPPEKLKQALPVPGLEVTDATLKIAFSQTQISATGGFAVRYQNIADGRVEARIGPDGFTASGTINLHIPGLDEARGEVWVRQGRFGGRITIGADKLKFPGVRSANLVITVQDGALDGQGTLQLSIPGVREARLGFGLDRQGRFGISGTAILSIPGVREATITLAYREGDLTGEANVGLDVPGLEGAGAQFQLRYARGALTGTGNFSYRRGRLSGTVRVALSERHRLSGGGELAYEIAPGLQAFANLNIDEQGRTRIQGGLRVPETIDLFDRRQVERDIFRTPTIEIPIFAIPLGPRSLGVVATIDARVIGRASVGPGQLRRVRLVADFDPSNESGAFGFQAAAELFVPANAELAVAVSGGIGLSVGIARAVGGIEAEGAAGVQANFIASADLRYQAGQFAVAGRAELSAQPRLAFRLRAFVRVDADLFFTTIEVYRKEWKLAEFEAGAGLKVGVRMPFNYVFGQPFKFDAAQVEFIRPQLDASSLMKELLPK